MRGGCHRKGAGCAFVHPDDPNWAKAPPSSFRPKDKSGDSVRVPCIPPSPYRNAYRGVPSLGVTEASAVLPLPLHGKLAQMPAQALLTQGVDGTLVADGVVDGVADGVPIVDGIPGADGTPEALRQHQVRPRAPLNAKIHPPPTIGIKLVSLPPQVEAQRVTKMAGEGVQTRPMGGTPGATDGAHQVGGPTKMQTRLQDLGGGTLGTTNGERQVGGTTRTPTKTQCLVRAAHGMVGGEQAGAVTITRTAPGVLLKWLWITSPRRGPNGPKERARLSLLHRAYVFRTTRTRKPKSQGQTTNPWVSTSGENLAVPTSLPYRLP